MYSLFLFLIHILSYLWVLAHILPAVLNAFMNLALLENISMSFRTWVGIVCLKSGHSSPHLCQVLLLSAPSGFCTWTTQSTHQPVYCNCSHILLSPQQD